LLGSIEALRDERYGLGTATVVKFLTVSLPLLSETRISDSEEVGQCAEKSSVGQ
jgi:hypothetical protein